MIDITKEKEEELPPNLGQIIFPATGSWVRPICMAGMTTFP
jgi:hypothetical protein